MRADRVSPNAIILLHVATSYTAAISHRLKSAHLDSGGWSEIFVEAVLHHLSDVADIERELDYWSHDAVVLALKALQRESPADLASLRQTVMKQIYPEGPSNFIWEGFSWFFDYICSDID